MRALAAWLLPLVLGVAGLAAAQPAPRPGGGPAMGAATRSVSQYLQKERALEEAIAQRDRAAVERLVAVDVVLRSAASPDPDDLDAWLKREFAGPGRERLVRDLNVREIDDLAIASFVLGGGRGAAARPLFVVDVWRVSSGRLLARHVARAADAPPPPRRPSGRE